MSQKIHAGKQAQVTEDFMIIARLESLIAKQGLADALDRAQAYIEAGADAIMIHSCESELTEINEFCKAYQDLAGKVPLVAVPTTYNQVYESELTEMGFSVVIYANHLLRSAYPAMLKTAESILKHGRSKEADADCISTKDILGLIKD